MSDTGVISLNKLLDLPYLSGKTGLPNMAYCSPDDFCNSHGTYITAKANVMKITQLLILAVILVFTTGCPRPYSSTFCDSPVSLAVGVTCYKANEGLTVRTVGMNTTDSTIRYEWTVFIFADSSGREYFDHADITINKGGRQIIVPDSLLKDNQKIYVRVNTYCPGNGKAPGLRYNQFVKRYKKSDTCYKWEDQPF